MISTAAIDGMKKDDVVLYLSSDVAEHTEFYTNVVEPSGAKRMQKMPQFTSKGLSEVIVVSPSEGGIDLAASGRSS